MSPDPDNPFVQITRVVPRMLVHTPGQGNRWHNAYITGLVDGWRVTWRFERGWQCDCPGYPDCGHVTAIAAVVDPDALENRRAGNGVAS